MAFNKFGRGRRRVPGEMNKTEAAYAVHLESLRRQGLIEWFNYEGIKLKLADKTFYTPDFAVMMPDGMIELHDVKGTTKDKVTKESKPFVHDDGSTIKIKIAASIYPLQFATVWLDKLEGWKQIRY